MSIIKTLIPEEKTESIHNQVTIKCNGEVDNLSIGTGSYSVLFPPGNGKDILLAGGSIIKVDVSALGIKSTQDVSDSLDSLVNDLTANKIKSKNGSSIDDLVNLRREINQILYLIGKKSIKILSKDNSTKTAPSFYISSYNGKDSISSDNYDDRVNKICAIRLIPIELIEKILTKIKDLSTIKDTIGFSGEKLSDLKLDTEENLLNTMLELFPAYNIDSDNLNGASPVGVGGFYTLHSQSDQPDASKNLFFKLPNLATGFDYYNNEDFQLFFEIITETTISRIKINKENLMPSPKFSVANISKVMEYPNNKTSLDINIESNAPLNSSDYIVYLSKIAENIPNYKLPGLDISSQRVDLFAAPVLTQGITQDRKSIFDSESFKSNFISQNNLFIKERVSVESQILNVNNESQSLFDFYKTNGYPFTNSVVMSKSFLSFIGEMNRADIILFPDIVAGEASSKKTAKSEAKNDNAYYSAGSSGVYNPLISNRPHYFEQQSIPTSWIGSSNILGGDNVFDVIFDISLFKNIDVKKSNLFQTYVYDKKNKQLSKSSSLISLNPVTPKITVISPDGSGINVLNLDEVYDFKMTVEDTEGEVTLDILDANKNVIYIHPNKLNGSSGQVEFSIIFESANFLADTEYTIRITQSANLYSTINIILSKSSIDIALDEQNGQVFLNKEDPNKSIFFIDDEQSFFVNTKNKNESDNNYFSNIPCVYKNASLTISSPGKYFTEKNYKKMFAYIGLKSGDEDLLLSLTTEDKVIKITADAKLGVSQSLYIPSDIVYTFDASGSFSRINNKSAKISFPGEEYIDRNFDILKNIDKAYLVISSVELVNNESYSFDNVNVISIGSTDSKPFYFGPEIMSVVGQGRYDSNPLSSNNLSQIFVHSEISSIYNFFGVTSINTGNLNFFEKAKKLVIIFEAYDSFVEDNAIKFFVGDKNISNNRVKSLKMHSSLLNKRLCIAFFKDISISDEGYKNIYIDVKNNFYNISYNLNTLNKRGSFLLDSESYTFNDNLEAVTTKNFESYGLLGDFYNTLFSYEGVLIKNTGPASNPTLNFYNPIKIKPTLSLALELKKDDLFYIAKDYQSYEINSLMNYIKIYSDNILNTRATTLNTVDQSILSAYNLEISNPSAVQFNVPEIVNIKRKRGYDVVDIDDFKTDLKEQKAFEDLESEIKIGEELIITVKNVKKDFVIVFSTNILNITVQPIGDIEKTDSPNKFLGSFIVPKDLQGVKLGENTQHGCLKISASAANEDRNKAKKKFGEFFEHIEQGLDRLKSGASKFQTAQINKVKGVAEKFPLRYVNVKIKDTTESAALLNSFCEYSYGMTANLKIALDGFQTILIPVKIIFCIIDVICSLINPFAMIMAIIRLFQCLYDLILMLPQISVPVMFFQLILHVIKLLECIFEKIITNLKIINEIIVAIQQAVAQKSLASALSLEEVLNEYLLKVELDLQFLGPVMSILEIFLQLLQLIFRFPCNINPEDDATGLCGISGSLLVGLVAGKAAGGGTIDPSFLVPLAQPYRKISIDDVADCADLDSMEVHSDDDIIARKSDTQTYLESAVIDPDTLRGNVDVSHFDFAAAFSLSSTKIVKLFGKPTKATFKFKEKIDITSAHATSEIVSGNYNADSGLSLTYKDGDYIKLSSSASPDGNIISFNDGYEFITKEATIIPGHYNGSVKPLQLQLDIPIYDVDPTTGELVQVDTNVVYRTFDGVPAMAMMDDRFNLYFIEEGGIKIEDSKIVSITAILQNTTAVDTMLFSKEDGASSDDGLIDCPTATTFTFPQIYFVDMRTMEEDIERMCSTSSLNSFLFDNNDVNDIGTIVTSANVCLTDYIKNIQKIITDMRVSIDNGIIPAATDLDFVNSLNSDVVACLTGTVDDICKYVVNSLNTSFMVLEDTDDTDLIEFPDISASADVLQGFEAIEPALTGAKEYASGIGDSANIYVNHSGTISVTPRDSYDLPIESDISDKIKIDIISDSTGSAKFIKDINGNIITYDGSTYTAKITSNNLGVVKIRGSICGQTIQAITYSDVTLEDIHNLNQPGVDCISDNQNVITTTPITQIGAIKKIDRILTINFTKEPINPAPKKYNGFGDGNAVTNPQEYGTRLVN